MSDLEQVIADSVNDAQLDETPDVEVSSSDAPSEPVEAPVEASSEEPVEPPSESPEVASPAATAAPEATSEEPQDAFAKLVGVPQTGVGGRENRIPYSRVKKITEKAVGDAVGEIAEVALGRKLNQGEKAVDVIKAHVAQIPDLQTKVTDYESRLEAVGQFEQVMTTDPEKFLDMLSQIPVYKPFFEFVEKAYAAQQTGAPAPAASNTPAAPVVDGMPEPDEELSDGSKVYSMEGLKRLLEWNAQATENRVISKYETKIQEIEKRYKPIESEWQERRRIESTLPVIRKQIEEAKQWPLFAESEAEIVEALRKDPKISLEAAYRQVVFPKLVAERNKVRQDVIKEVQAAPVATSVPARAASKPSSSVDGPRSLEDVIRDQVANIKR